MKKILNEEINRNYKSIPEEIINYFPWSELSLPDYEDFLCIDWNGLKAPLPRKRKRCEIHEGNIYIFNSETRQSKQQHPCESHYKQLVREAKRLNGLENVEPKTKVNLLNYQISIKNDFNSKLKETENALNAIDTLRNKTAEILSRPNNPELEMDFRATCTKYKVNSNLHHLPLRQACTNYLKAYQQKISLYILKWDGDDRITYLEIYNTETKTEEFKILKTPQALDFGTCITQIPNGKIFCIGNSWYSRIVVLTDVNGVVEVLPSGTSCGYSSCIYFNKCVYCFGGLNRNGCLRLSNRFDLDWKRWIQLAPMPWYDKECSIIIFNRNIMISGYKNRNLLLYSIDIDSFSTIPYQFKRETRKILINAERLYLIECDGSIYENEIESYTNWREIGNSIIRFSAKQVYYSYNKGRIYICCSKSWKSYFYKFDLNKKLISKLKKS